MANEADTCRLYVLPKLDAAGWDSAPASIAEQRTFTDGRIVLVGNRPERQKQKRADYLLRLRSDFTFAVVEAKPEYRLPGDGLQQAKDDAEILGLKFACSTDEHGIIEFDYTNGRKGEFDAFPTPAESPRNSHLRWLHNNWSAKKRNAVRTALRGMTYDPVRLIA